MEKRWFNVTCFNCQLFTRSYCWKSPETAFHDSWWICSCICIFSIASGNKTCSYFTFFEVKTHVVLTHVCPESGTSLYALKCFNFSISSYFAFIKLLPFWFSIIIMALANSVVFRGNGFQWTASRLTLNSDKSFSWTL